MVRLVALAIAILVVVPSSALADPPDQFTPDLVYATMSYETADPALLMSEWAPDSEPLGVFACDPVAPDKVEARKCCLGTKNNPLNASDLGNYFCYCLPAKIVSVCGNAGNQASYPLIKSNAEWCVYTSTHPFWPGTKLSCSF